MKEAFDTTTEKFVDAVRKVGRGTKRLRDEADHGTTPPAPKKARNTDQPSIKLKQEVGELKAMVQQLVGAFMNREGAGTAGFPLVYGEPAPSTAHVTVVAVDASTAQETKNATTKPSGTGKRKR